MHGKQNTGSIHCIGLCEDVWMQIQVVLSDEYGNVVLYTGVRELATD